MNKKTIITALLALVAMVGQAQEIKMNETTINDYIPMLNQKGYQAYSFDVSTIKGRNVTINVREFVNGKEVEDSPRLLFPYYFEARGEKFVFGFLPSETDSLVLCYFNWENTLRSSWSLKLKQLYWESENKYVYSYRSDPFEPTSPLEKETFIPLVYYSSFWYDAEDKVIVSPTLSNEVLITTSLESNTIKNDEIHYCYPFCFGGLFFRQRRGVICKKNNRV